MKSDFCIDEWFAWELSRLEREASGLAREYYAWLKSTGDLVELWVRVRRLNGSLQIEWAVPSWGYRHSDGKARSSYLPKGKGHRYPSSTLLRHVPEQYQAKVLEFERAFAEIRLAARLLTEVRRAAGRYRRQAASALGETDSGGESLAAEKLLSKIR